ncbi:MAG: YhcH/YjgK/YiaL family protein [Candidatus Synoicihabitans palmerolidicus]|nr:YhcH/YjgK/YiaL family protein [Candidatus Synoicihabitans palmerolidicus]
MGTLEMVSQQLAPSERFDVALAYLREAFDPMSTVHARIMAVPQGETRRVDLADGVFALEQVYEGKRPKEGRFEAHEMYVVQAMVSGDERMEVTTAKGLKVTEDALAERDVVFYVDGESASVWGRCGRASWRCFSPRTCTSPRSLGAR